MKKFLLFSGIFALITTSSFAQLTNGLVAHYTFNNGNANDEQGNNHGTVSGATLTTDRFGNNNKAYSFDGVDDHITLGDVTEFQMGTSDFTISVWVYYTASQQSTIFSKRDGISTNYNMYALSVMADPQFGGASENIWGFMRSSNSIDRAIDGGVQSGVWHNIVLHHDYSDSTSIFVDGNFIGKSTVSLTGDFDIIGNPLVLGYAAEANANFYNGKMDDIRIYNRVLNALEIDSLFYEKNPETSIALTTGLVSKYSFNNGDANDEASSIDGFVNGPSLTTDRFGNASHAFNFDGINDEITFGLPTDFSFGQGIFTYNFWAKFSNSQFAPLLNKRNDAPNYDQYAINVGEFGSPNNTVGFYYKPSPGGIGGPIRQTSSTILNNSWHMITVINYFDYCTALYVDGEFISSSHTPFTSENFNISGANLIAGYTNIGGTNYYYNGSLDDIRVYNRAINEIEIDELFNEPNPATLSLEENNGNIDFSVYPNPANDLLTIQSNNLTKISVLNLIGIEVIQLEINKIHNMDISSLAKGVYFIRDLNTLQTIRFVKN